MTALLLGLPQLTHGAIPPADATVFGCSVTGFKVLGIGFRGLGFRLHRDMLGVPSKIVYGVLWGYIRLYRIIWGLGLRVFLNWGRLFAMSP